MKKLILIALFFLAGCATLPQVPDSPQVDTGNLDHITGWFTDALLKDATGAAQWCEGQEGPTEPNDKVLCALCGNTIISEHAGIMADKQEVLSWLEANRADLANGPQVITYLTKKRFGKQVDIQAIERRVFNRYLNIRNACANIVPEWQILQLAGFAAGFMK